MDLNGIVDQVPLLAALALGLVTAVSPCTLAANISGAAFITRSMKTPRYALLVGVLLSLGRISTFLVIGGMMIYAGHTIGGIALLSQNVGSILLGCVLLFLGILFLDVVRIDIDLSGGFIPELMKKAHALGLLGALFLGMLYGLAFCPYSAALFFGMLIPLAVRASEGYILPVMFGIGVNIPVLLYTGMIYVGMRRAKPVMQKISQSWAVIKEILGIVLISASFYYLGPYISMKVDVSLEWLPFVLAGVLGIAVIFRHILRESS